MSRTTWPRSIVGACGGPRCWRKLAPASDPIPSRGASTKEIARTLSLAESTVKIDARNILRKLDIASRALRPATRRRSLRRGHRPDLPRNIMNAA
ncbi:LuxR C-terminal-related transcriptional regulator [Caballeronia sp. AZ10_KS36]|uniref:LuxR C-terminal-related transcriptional regulator n=1 Tax=Caballeronia sp. AZ10_KS36 TaxID=2921757 RepID=UPI002027C5BA|nr:LuxR C-terminal-related transcriptional regulator [Caballeronia sp. AZ10_KS36]